MVSIPRTFLLLAVMALAGMPGIARGGEVTHNPAAGRADQPERILPESVPPGANPGTGVREIPGKEGGKDIEYFSEVTREEEEKALEEEKEKTDRSWDLLRNVIIDRRRTR